MSTKQKLAAYAAAHTVEVTSRMKGKIVDVLA